jgi:uncharacterized membrane protein
MLKNTFLYYIAISIPFAGLIYLAKTGSNTAFVICLLVYVFIYRPLTDRHRLLAKGVITIKKARKFYFVGISSKYFRELYFS